MKQTITITVYTNRDGIDVTLPARWAICPDCEGCATDRGRSVECDGGGFTASEFAEACDDDPDYGDDEPGFARKYFGGFYDRPCEPCKGLGRVQEINEEAVTGWRERILLKAYRTQQRDNAEIDAIHAAERRMGA